MSTQVIRVLPGSEQFTLYNLRCLNRAIMRQMNYITKILDNERNRESIWFLYLIKETGRSSNCLPNLPKILRQLCSV